MHPTSFLDCPSAPSGKYTVLASPLMGNNNVNVQLVKPQLVCMHLQLRGGIT